MIKIIPTILALDQAQFESNLRRLENFFPTVHLDVMDGKFVPNVTDWRIQEIAKIKTPAVFELHLMVENPLEYIKQAQALTNVEKILFHFETASDLQAVVKAIRALRCRAYMVVNPDTDIEDIKNELVEVDGVMLMSVFPGFSGQKFVPETLERVKQVRKLHRSIDIQVDGGVNDTTVRALVEAGATTFAVGSFISHGDPRMQEEKILKALR